MGVSGRSKHPRGGSLVDMLSLAIRLSRVASILLLLAGLVLPWYHVPTGLKPDAKGGLSATFADPGSTIIFKALIVAILFGYCSTAVADRLTNSVVPDGWLAQVWACFFWPRSLIRRLPFSDAPR